MMNLSRFMTPKLYFLLIAFIGGEMALSGCSSGAQESEDDATGGSRTSSVGGDTAVSSSGGSDGFGGESSSGGASTVDVGPLPGFRAEYFAHYRPLVLSRVEPVVSHVWAEGVEPGAGVGHDRFSARYTAILQVPEAGTYTFATEADDGVRLWIGEELVLDDWRAHLAQRHEGQLELPAGEVSLRLEYFEANLGAELSLYWTAPGGAEELLDETHVVVSDGIPKAPMPDYQNAVLKSNCPDPGVFSDTDRYYMVCTGGRFRIYTSYDLVIWEATENFVLPAGKPAWAANGGRNWAPEMHKVGDKYVVYYTTVNGANKLSIGASWADSPLGPYTEGAGPLVEAEPGVIDSNYFEDTDGKRYLTYKIDGNADGLPTPIYIRELASDGLSFADGSSQVEILRNSSATWEGGVVEAQWLFKQNDTYFLVYSGNVYNHQYRTGVARADNLFGPYVKHGNPILTNNNSWVGPGHGSVVPAGDDLYFVYHAWVNDGTGKNDSEQGRQVLVDRITFENNWPVIANGSPSTEGLPRPGSD